MEGAEVRGGALRGQTPPTASSLRTHPWSWSTQGPSSPPLATSSFTAQLEAALPGCVPGSLSLALGHMKGSQHPSRSFCSVMSPSAHYCKTRHWGRERARGRCQGPYSRRALSAGGNQTCTGYPVRRYRLLLSALKPAGRVLACLGEGGTRMNMLGPHSLISPLPSARACT